MSILERIQETLVTMPPKGMGAIVTRPQLELIERDLAELARLRAKAAQA